MCDTLVVRTDDGILFAKNSDRDPNEPQLIRWYPAADHAPGDEVTCTGMTIDQVPHTHAVALSQPWWMWGSEMGANDQGVVIGNQAVFNRAGTSKHGLLGMDLVRLALERAADAADAVGVMVELLERHGQGGSCSHDHPGFRYDNSFLVADPNEVIVLETARRDWATEEATGRVRSISNGYTIPAFAKAHADPLRARVACSADRRCRTERSGGTAQGPGDLFAALRDHGDDGIPRFSRLNGALGAPCAHAGGFATATQTTASWVADLRGAGRPIHWVTATAAPCTSIFKPVRVEEPMVPDATAQVTNRYEETSTWWRHERFHRLVMRDHAAATARFDGARDRLEADWLANPPSTTDAFTEAERRTDTWHAELVAADLADRRPRWLRNMWRRFDETAELLRPDRVRTPADQLTSPPQEHVA